jgi:hypothetical protein
MADVSTTLVEGSRCLFSRVPMVRYQQDDLSKTIDFIPVFVSVVFSLVDHGRRGE